ncbi:UNVERIFIED_CONTAM: hypothetical protein RMT77_010829 [Armadillidium vulgare]
MRLLILLFHIIFFLAAEAEFETDSKFLKLCEEYFKWRISDMPQYATRLGIHDYDTELNDMSEEAYENRLKTSQLFLERLESISPYLMNQKEFENFIFLRYELRLYVESWNLKGYYLALNYMEGPHKYVTQLFSYMPRNNPKDFEVILKRLEKLPRQMDQIIDLLNAGIKNNITLHSLSLKNLNQTLGKFAVEDPKLSPYYNLFRDKISSTPEYKEILNKALDVIKTQVSPAYEKLRNYILNEYIPRQEISITGIRNGTKFYEACIWYQTSSNFSAEEIHNIGKKEVESLEKEMKKIVDEMGFLNMSVQEFSNKIKNDPKNFFKSSEDLSKEIERIVFEVIRPRLKNIFKSLPKTKLIVKGDNSPNGIKAYYEATNLNLSKPGKFVFNSYDPNTQPKYDLLTLALHEGEPGHHLQISHALESENFPLLRKSRDTTNTGMTPSRFPHYAFFVEGWGLYAETLGFDMNLFGNLLERYGHYSMRMYRACRLVVDTGLHAFGWTREEAVNYMFTRTASTKPEIENEIDRYITWPGQALSYMIGYIKIRKLREDAELELKEHFDLKKFHEIILDSFGPFEIAENQVQKWIRHTSEIHKFFKHYWDWKLYESPQFSTFVGEHKDSSSLDDLSYEKYTNRVNVCGGYLHQLDYILRKFVMKNSDKINVEIMRHEIKTYVDGIYFTGYFLPVNFFEGPHRYPKTLFKRMPRKDEEDFNNIIKRMKKIPRQIDQMIDLMEMGINNDITNHEISMKNLNELLGKFIVNDPKRSPFYQNLFGKEILPKNFSRKSKWMLQRRAKNVIKDELVPAFKKLHYYVTEEYFTRENISVETMKEGFYQALISFHTSTNYTAQEIHDIGLKEVERIEKEMQKVISEMGLQNTSAKEFSEKIRNDPQNYYNSSEDLLNGLKEMVERINPHLEKLFHTIPKAKLEIVGDRSPYQTFASYVSGSLDGTEPGKFVMSIYDPKNRPKYDLLTLTLHEGIPGHHFQISYAIESSKYPNFRKFKDDSDYGIIPSRFPAYSSFVEGWALYSESLGFDMQLFDDPLERYGHYSAEMFRACRLVVDTGLHALGWTKEKALEYMLRYTANPKAKLENEIDRYITWPGQALSYKIGELKIRQLREEAEKKLGNKFNIKDFHEIILDSQGPMEILESQVQTWIESQLHFV